ncbi:hypothetical protein S4A8_16137 [Salinisphaera sp. S4-8]|uniref:tetratricopeptide repeat protein n=1 Tax=Salinisphaera sp. S4-8 TaxID=633357 RepID=UPI00333FA879
MFYGLLFWAILIAAAWLFWAGLSGPFLFDDIRNLEPLGFDGGISNAADLARFVFSGESGPLGRPFSLLTFAMNDVSWPSDPWLFKYTNLLIHILNGVLVFTLTRQLCRLCRTPENQTLAVALCATAIWLIHPLQLTPVFLVVQRMTELSALFVLAGLVTYLRGRRTAATRPLIGYVLMSLGVGLGGILAVLSKENGILLPLFIVVIEATIASGAPQYNQRPRAAWRAVFIWLPIVLLAAYILRGVLYSDGGLLPRRNFTMGERLLTEARVLMDYLRLTLLPNLNGSGLFHDDYVPSKGLLKPATTVFSIVVLAALFIAALFYRRRYPVLAFGILWFLAGHALEAGPVNLELYFEHRNYLPLLGPAFAAAWYALVARMAMRRFVVGGLLAFTTLCALATWNASAVWGDTWRLAAISADENPRSIRAQQFAARYWFDRGDKPRTTYYLKRALSTHTDAIGVAFQTLYVDCTDGKLDTIDLTTLVRMARQGRYTPMVGEMLKLMRTEQVLKQCDGLSLDELLKISRNLLGNPNYQMSEAQSMLYYEIAQIYADKRVIDKALEAADRAYSASPDYRILMQCAAWLASAGDYKLALKYVDKSRSSTKGVAWYELFLGQKQREIDRLEQAILEART